MKALKLKEKFIDYDLSLHTQLSRIFSCNERNEPEFNEAEINLFKAEIVVSKIIGINQINFHMKEGFLTNEEKSIFQKLVSFAREKGVDLIYESNTHAKAENTLQFLKDFPEINYCLDFGHINTAIKNNDLGMDLKEFINKIKGRTVHIHAHNNYGEDSHDSLDNGDFPWREVLNMLRGQNLKKIIIESKTKKSINESKKLLEEYYSKKNEI